MALRLYKPVTAGQRRKTTRDNSAITAKKPVKSLLRPRTSAIGKNNQGRITSRHRGAGVRRHYRMVNFLAQEGAAAKVLAVEYDPNRSGHILRVEYGDGKLGYVLAHHRAKVGSTIKVGNEAPVAPGNRLPLRQIPVGSTIFNVEVTPGKGGQLVRSAGVSAQLTAREGNFVHVRLPSGEIRLLPDNCYATLGSVGNEQHQNIIWGSAGRNRRRGKRPHVRGKAMNPVDHPMGGGEGQTGPGRLPRTPWGALAIGKKTRKVRKSNRLIVRRRNQKRS